MPANTRDDERVARERASRMREIEDAIRNGRRHGLEEEFAGAFGRGEKARADLRTFIAETIAAVEAEAAAKAQAQARAAAAQRAAAMMQPAAEAPPSDWKQALEADGLAAPDNLFFFPGDEVHPPGLMATAPEGGWTLTPDSKPGFGEGAAALIGTPAHPILAVVPDIPAGLVRLSAGACEVRVGLGSVTDSMLAGRERVEIIADAGDERGTRAAARGIADRVPSPTKTTLALPPAEYATFRGLRQAAGPAVAAEALLHPEAVKRSHAKEEAPAPLTHDSDVAIAHALLEDYEAAMGPLVSTEDGLWWCDRGVFRMLDERRIVDQIHRFDGTSVPAGARTKRVRLNDSRVKSILGSMVARGRDDEFFGTAPSGIACANGWLELERQPGGVTTTLTPLMRHHKAKHVLPGRWRHLKRGELWRWYRKSKLAKLLYGALFAKRDGGTRDPGARGKRQLLVQVMGIVLAGLATRLQQPKAIVLYGETGNNGKDTIVRLIEHVVDPTLISHEPPRGWHEETKASNLVGKVLNTTSELDVDRINADVFKAVVSGEPFKVKRLYRDSTSATCRAAHLFTTNHLPRFTRVDGGVKRRLAFVEFTRRIPESEVIVGLAEQIAAEEADLLLQLAVRGAKEVMEAGSLRVPEAAAQTHRQWAIETDPVAQYIEAELVIVDEKPVSQVQLDPATGLLVPTGATIVRKVKPDCHLSLPVIYKDFQIWAEKAGYSKLPNRAAFGRRLRALLEGLRTRKSHGEIRYENIYWPEHRRLPDDDPFDTIII
jgi:P4 family phage/plasmid primase-like protien